MLKESGIFPAKKETAIRFSNMLLDILPDIDMLTSCSWLRSEQYLHNKYFPNANIISLGHTSSFIDNVTNPWTEALENKKVLIVYPFIETIKKQYKKRTKLFANPKVLPKFTLKTLSTVQSLGYHSARVCGYETWFDALDAMCHQINNIDFDIAVIGAGGYGIFLAHHVKSIGKKAIHIGGATQLLFGIKGGRWTKWGYDKHLYNEHWVSPSPKETPKNFTDIGDGPNTYW